MGFPAEVPLSGEATYNPPPFIAVEVLSKSTAKVDRGDKFQTYERAGVALYVIVDLKKRALEIYRLQDGKYARPEILQGDAVWQPKELLGLRIELARLWFDKQVG
jgi:Uma2 family endonuclease